MTEEFARILVFVVVGALLSVAAALAGLVGMLAMMLVILVVTSAWTVGQW